jgi:phage shock protein PspC (stress-responsive transcriptional regulator)
MEQRHTTYHQPDGGLGVEDDGERRLRRAVDGRLVGGVAAGLADYFDVDVVVVRIAFVAVTLLAGIGVPLYLAAWVLIPSEDEEESVAERVLGRDRQPSWAHVEEHDAEPQPPRDTDVPAA